MRARRWLTGALASLAALAGGAAAAVSPIGAHSMLQLDDPPSFMQAMFADATVSWTLQRAPHAVDARCGETLTAASPASPAAGHATPAAGHATRWVLRLRGDRRPGTYRLTAAARNAHGRGPRRILWLTVS